MSKENQKQKSDESNNNIDESDLKLSLTLKIGYGCGHVLNDLFATVWFSYTLLFLKDVLQMPTEAGSFMMLGQLTDAFFSAIVGFLTDLYGTKRNWHFIGSIIVCLSFPMIFVMQRDMLPYWVKIFYFSAIIALFQCGWATVQISHLAIIPEYSGSEKERSELNAVRFSMSILSNITVFVVAYIFLHIRDKLTDEIGPDDFDKFRVRLQKFNISFFLLQSITNYLKKLLLILRIEHHIIAYDSWSNCDDIIPHFLIIWQV